MKIIKNDLEIETEIWEDPGDYPNAAASGPLPSSKYIAAVNGQVVIELTEQEFREYLADTAEFLNNLEIDLPPHILSCKFTGVLVSGRSLTLSVSEFEGDNEFEDDYYDSDD